MFGSSELGTAGICPLRDLCASLGHLWAGDRDRQDPSDKVVLRLNQNQAVFREDRIYFTLAHNEL